MTADVLRLEASGEARIGERVSIDVGEFGLHSTGAHVYSSARIMRYALGELRTNLP